MSAGGGAHVKKSNGNIHFSSQEVEMTSGRAAPKGLTVPLNQDDSSSNDDYDDERNATTRSTGSVLSSAETMKVSSTIKKDMRGNTMRNLASTYSKNITSMEDAINANEKIETCCMISPTDPFRQVWDLVMVVGLFWTAIKVPLDIAFEFEDIALNMDNEIIWYTCCNSWHFWTNRIVDLIFVVDICLNFFTAVEKNMVDDDVHEDDDDDDDTASGNSKYIDGHGKVACLYLKGWFMIDFFSTLPVDIIVMAGTSGQKPTSGGSVARSVKMMRLVKLARITKMLRLFRVKRVFEAIEQKFDIHYSLITILSFIVRVLALGHVMGCAMIIQAKFQENDTGECTDKFSWVEPQGYNCTQFKDRANLCNNHVPKGMAEQICEFSRNPMGICQGYRGCDSIKIDEDCGKKRPPVWGKIGGGSEVVDEDMHDHLDRIGEHIPIGEANPYHCAYCTADGHECTWNPQNTWIKGSDWYNDDAYTYVASLYWAFTTMTTVGYGDISATNIIEQIICIIAFIIGGIIFAYGMTQIIEKVQDINHNMQEFRRQMNNLYEYMNYHNVPPALKSDIKRYLRYRFQNHFCEEADFMNILNHSLRRRFVSGMHTNRFSNVKLFKHFSEDFLAELMTRLAFECVAKDEPIVEEGHSGHKFYVIEKGSVRIHHEGMFHPEKDMVMKKTGFCFGEWHVIFPHKHTTNITAIKWVELRMLTYSDFWEVLELFPDDWHKARRFQERKVYLIQQRKGQKKKAKAHREADIKPQDDEDLDDDDIEADAAMERKQRKLLARGNQRYTVMQAEAFYTEGEQPDHHAQKPIDRAQMANEADGPKWNGIQLRSSLNTTLPNLIGVDTMMEAQGGSESEEGESRETAQDGDDRRTPELEPEESFSEGRRNEPPKLDLPPPPRVQNGYADASLKQLADQGVVDHDEYKSVQKRTTYMNAQKDGHDNAVGDASVKKLESLMKKLESMDKSIRTMQLPKPQASFPEDSRQDSKASDATIHLHPPNSTSSQLQDPRQAGAKPKGTHGSSSGTDDKVKVYQRLDLLETQAQKNEERLRELIEQQKRVLKLLDRTGTSDAGGGIGGKSEASHGMGRI